MISIQKLGFSSCKKIDKVAACSEISMKLWLDNWSCLNSVKKDELLTFSKKAIHPPKCRSILFKNKFEQSIIFDFDNDRVSLLLQTLLGPNDSAIEINRNKVLNKIAEHSIIDFGKRIIDSLEVDELDVNAQMIEMYDRPEFNKYDEYIYTIIGPIAFWVSASLIKTENRAISAKKNDIFPILNTEDVEVSVSLPQVKIKLSDLSSLKSGMVIQSDTLVTDSLSVNVGGKSVGECYLAGRNGYKSIVFS